VDKSDVQEILVMLYLRLNGYFGTGFIVHAPQRNKTEMDVLAIRFPGHREPEREVQCSEHLVVPSGCVDFLVGEVKGGLNNVTFNVRFREDAASIRTVLNRFGAFEDQEIEHLCECLPNLLKPEKVRKSRGFPTLALRDGQYQLRFVLFAAEQRRDKSPGFPYVFEDDLLSFVWTCFRPEQRRAQCDIRYNYELWGPQFVDMVRYFKKSENSPQSIKELYSLYSL
jgi:hypothetical protein